jgi:uncharacterized protein YidB (DUF937 family)
MGLFDIAESMLTNCLSGGGQGGGGAQSVVGAVMSALNNQPGGLGGVVESLSKGGLGDVVSSWIGNGPNPPVTTGQLQGALGSGTTDAIAGEIAGKLGISPEMATTVLSQVLPHLVDHLTPNGQVPPGGLSSAGGGLLNSIIGGALGSMGAGR